MTRLQIESLSTDELIQLADNLGIDIPHDLERIFIIDELLECANTANKESTESIIENPSYSETVPLPKQYNISFIELIIRDPLWVYVFWEVKEFDREIHEKAADFEHYMLRVIPLNDDNTVCKKGDETFVIPVEKDDNARYLGFAGYTGAAEQSTPVSGHYIIKLGAVRGGKEHQIALSKPFYLPRLITNHVIQQFKASPLIRLSGIADLPVMISRSR